MVYVRGGACDVCGREEAEVKEATEQIRIGIYVWFTTLAIVSGLMVTMQSTTIWRDHLALNGILFGVLAIAVKK